MAPPAGKPPFATDEPDSFYETPPQPRRVRLQDHTHDANKRTSAYDVYDNYTGTSANANAATAPAPTRNSGIGALLLNMDMSDDSDDDSDDDSRPANPPGINAMPSPSPMRKNAALAAATGVLPPYSPGYQQHQQQGGRSPSPGQYQQQQQQPRQIAAPRPGYAAPIAALNLARPEAAATLNPMPQPQHHQQMQKPAPLRINPHAAQNPFEPPSPHRQHQHQNQHANLFPPPPLSPSPSLHSSTPHPLLPPVTPITPAFIRPAKIPPPAAISFEDGVSPIGGGPLPRKGIIMRGDSEETLLPSRGEKGDDFWRRFSMVVKEDSKKPGGLKESRWLRKTQTGISHYSRWVWIIGMFLLVIVAGAIGIAAWRAHKTPAHQQPEAIGGSADNAATYSTSSTARHGAATGSSSSRLHVSPTNTVARREDAAATPTPVVELKYMRDVEGNASVKRGIAKMHAHRAHPVKW